jgi:hypothetical protein
MSGVFS